jgi:ribosomal protein S18 acetylase RimI-like enzyme
MNIPVQRNSGPCPLSYSQQRLWFLDQLHPGNSAYNVYRAARIEGPLDIPALERSFQEIVRRHQILRTTIGVEQGIPFQIISPPAPVPLLQVDLRDLPPPKRDGEILRLANEESHRPFSLSKDLLLRTTLLRLGDIEQVLLATTHHIAADGWSVGILFSELSRLYEAFAAGKPSPLPELPLQFADFAAWQRQWLTGPVLEKQITYWKEKLAGLPPSLDLPTDRRRPVLQKLANFRGERHYFVMPKALLGDLMSLSRQEGVTLFMTVLAAFKVLLRRYSGRPDIVVGSPIAGRNRPELESLIGCFSNTLVLRSDSSGDPTFKDHLRRIREMALGAFANEDVPFEKLVEELHPKRVLNRNPLFQVNFRLLTTPQPPMKLAGLKLSFLPVDNHMAKFDLALELGIGEDGLGGYIEYFTDLFEPSTIASIINDLEELLGTVVAQPSTSLTALTRRPALPRTKPTMTETENKSIPNRLLRGVKRQPVVMSLGQQATAPAPQSAPANEPSTPLEKYDLQYKLRKATMKDCAFIYRMRVETLKPYVSQFPGWPAEQQEAYYLDFDVEPYWIVVADGRDVGDWGLVRKENFIDVLGIHLLPDHPVGLGTKIARDLIKEADSKGVPIVARVIKTNQRALKLWLRLGFQITGETEHHYEIKRPCANHPGASGDAQSPRDQPVDKALGQHATVPAPQSAPANEHSTPAEKYDFQYTLRKATMKDCAFIYQLRSETLGPYVSQFQGWSVEQQEAYYMDFDPATHWIVVVEGKDIGDMCVVRTHQYIDYRGLHLLPDHPKGLGTMISQELFREADEKRLPVLGRCIKANMRALKFWLRLGFVITGERENQYTMVRPWSGQPLVETCADAPGPRGERQNIEKPVPSKSLLKGPKAVKRKPVGLSPAVPPPQVIDAGPSKETAAPV